MKRIITRLVMVIVIIVALFLGLQMKNQNQTKKEKPEFKIEVDGMKIELDKTSVYDLTQNGFTITDSSYKELASTAMVPSKTVTSHDAATAMKDNKKYFDFGVINRLSTDRTLTSAELNAVSINYGEEGKDGKKAETDENTKIFNFSPKGMTKSEIEAKLKEEIGEEYVRETDENQLMVTIDDHMCTYNFKKDGKLESVIASVSVSLKIGN
ncbi:hypothetical protein lbkm_0166 [Lachnospiraceae bacterium KM106-2]|nr:hypothetical protein lbkm_0166 [Lachnospiraceae bacterium KM106-2]